MNFITKLLNNQKYIKLKRLTKDLLKKLSRTEIAIGLIGVLLGLFNIYLILTILWGILMMHTLIMLGIISVIVGFIFLVETIYKKSR